MPVEGYDSASYVRNNYEILRLLIIEMVSGLLLDLVRRFQIRAGVKEDKAREYVTASASEGWIEVTLEGKVLDAVHISMALKYLRPVTFASKLGSEETERRAPVTETEEPRRREPDNFLIDSREVDGVEIKRARYVDVKELGRILKERMSVKLEE
jgi:hypothetical protein